MRPRDLSKTLAALIPTGQPVFLQGPPGVGKSSLVWQAASEVFDGATVQSTVGGLPDVPWFTVIRATDRDPVDLRGIPYHQDGFTLWAKPDLLPQLESSQGGVICIEELPQALPAVQCVLRELLLDRRIGGHPIPEGWSVMTTGNRPEDRAGAGRLLSHVAASVIVLDVEVSVSDWQKWAVRAGVAPDIRGFINFRPLLLHHFDSAKLVNADPRGYERLSKVINVVPPVALLAVAAGCIGEGPAAEFLAFRELYRKLPDPSDILASPMTATVPKEDNVCYALCAALAERVRDLGIKIVPPVVTFAERLEPEFGALLIKDTLRVCPTAVTSDAVVEWVRNHHDLFEDE